MIQVTPISTEQSELRPAHDQMWAGVYRGPGRVVLEQVPVPEISEDEILLRVEACGICGTDLKKIYKGLVQPPQILGHEIAGTVAQTGAAVRRWKPGDRVVCFHHVPCRRCFFCHQNLFSQCAQYKRVGVTAGFQPNGGGFAEYVRVMPWIIEAGMLEIPPDIAFEEAIFVEPVNTCWKAIRKALIKPDEIVVVAGQGAIGLLLMMLARHAGARALTTDPLPWRRQKSMQLGAEASFDSSDTALVDAIRSRTETRGADAVVVAAPRAELLREALAMTRPGGRVLLFAANDPSLSLEFPGAAVGIDEKQILGSYSAAWDLQQESARFVFERVLPVGQLVTHSLPLAQIERGLALAAFPSQDSLKVVLKP